MEYNFKVLVTTLWKIVSPIQEIILKPTYIRGLYSTRVAFLRIDCAYIMKMTHSSGNRVIFLRRIMKGGGVIILCRLKTAVIILQRYLICFTLTPTKYSSILSATCWANLIFFQPQFGVFSADDNNIFNEICLPMNDRLDIFTFLPTNRSSFIFLFWKSKHFS